MGSATLSLALCLPLTARATRREQGRANTRLTTPLAGPQMKFLSMSFREAMSDFFGKAGMPWHGVMFIRRAHGEEKATEGEYIVTYVDT